MAKKNIKFVELVGNRWAVECEHRLFGFIPRRLGVRIYKGYNGSGHPLREVMYESVGSLAYGSFCVFDDYQQAFDVYNEASAILGIRKGE